MPRINQSGAIRPVYYDRNPTDSMLGYEAGGVAPHAETTRWTYTVPASKKAYLEAGSVTGFIVTVAAPAALRAGKIYTTLLGGGGQSVLLEAVLGADLNAIGNKDRVSVSNLGFMSAGDIVLGTTQDLSTGGSVTWHVDVKRTEFDA